jgi:hypothetical protein
MPELTPREILVLRMHQIHGSPRPLLGSAARATSSGANVATSSGANVSSVIKILKVKASVKQLHSPAVQAALENPANLREVSSVNLRKIRRFALVPKISNSEGGVERVLEDLPVGGVREKVRILSAVMEFLDTLGGRKAVKYRKGKLPEVDPLQMTKNVVWKTATTAVPALRIVKSVAEKVIKAVIKRMRIWYNNKCSGKVRGKIQDASTVGRGRSMDAKCGRAQGEAQWISRGFKPYVWRTGVSTSKWSYSPLGFGKGKRAIKELLDARKRRGRKAPPKPKGRNGNRNMELYGLCPLPGAAQGG